MAWDYPDSLLQTLCRNCHIEVHKNTVIKSEKDLNKVKTKIKQKIKSKPKKKPIKKKKSFVKLSKEDQKLQDMQDKIKNRPQRKYIQNIVKQR